jgi:hypothetical protein
MGASGNATMHIPTMRQMEAVPEFLIVGRTRQAFPDAPVKGGGKQQKSHLAKCMYIKICEQEPPSIYITAYEAGGIQSCRTQFQLPATAYFFCFSSRQKWLNSTIKGLTNNVKPLKS